MAATVNVTFQRLFLWFFFAYNCILAHIIDACNYCKYIGNGSVVYMVKRLATWLTVTQYIELYISSVLAKETEIFSSWMIWNERWTGSGRGSRNNAIKIWSDVELESPKICLVSAPGRWEKTSSPPSSSTHTDCASWQCLIRVIAAGSREGGRGARGGSGVRFGLGPSCPQLTPWHGRVPAS